MNSDRTYPWWETALWVVAVLGFAMAGAVFLWKKDYYWGSIFLLIAFFGGLGGARR